MYHGEDIPRAYLSHAFANAAVDADLALAIFDRLIASLSGSLEHLQLVDSATSLAGSPGSGPVSEEIVVIIRLLWKSGNFTPVPLLRPRRNGRTSAREQGNLAGRRFLSKPLATYGPRRRRGGGRTGRACRCARPTPGPWTANDTRP